jgi:hypothetical protein
VDGIARFPRLFDRALLELELLDVFSRERFQLDIIERLAILGDALRSRFIVFRRRGSPNTDGALRAPLGAAAQMTYARPDELSAGCLQRRPGDASALSARRR